MPTPRRRLKPELNVEIDAGLLEQLQQRAKRSGVGLRLVVEEAVTRYLQNDGLPPSISAAVSQIEAQVTAIATQIEPIAAFVANVKYRENAKLRRSMTGDDDDGWRV